MDYSKHSVDELFECLNSIDKEAYPENYNSLVSEIESRESEIQDLQTKRAQEFSLSTESRRKLLSWLQIATAVSFLISLTFVAVNFAEPTLLALSAAFAILNGVAGYRLLKGKRFGFELSYVNQILQVVMIQSSFLIYSYTGLGTFIVGIGDGLFFNFSLLDTSFKFYSGSNLSDFKIGVDLVAIFFLYVLHSCKELGLDKDEGIK